MTESSQIDGMMHELAARLNEANHIVAKASAENRELTEVEDSQVLQLMKQVQNLDEAIARLRRHHGDI